MNNASGSVRPVPDHSSPPVQLSSLNELESLVGSLKRTLNRRLVARYAPALPAAIVRRAVDDAEELARSTGFPHLFLPALAEEKVRGVSDAGRAVFSKTRMRRHLIRQSGGPMPDRQISKQTCL